MDENLKNLDKIFGLLDALYGKEKFQTRTPTGS
jgi:hypothetical protein